MSQLSVAPPPLSTPPTPRLGQLDICRGLAILAVLFIHVSGHFLTVLHPAKSTATPGWAWDVLVVPNQCFQWAVPCFLMMSALVNAQSLARSGDLGTYAARRVQTALLPYLLWSGLYIGVDTALGILHHLTFGHIAKLLLTGTAHFHLYFFILVLEMYALLPILLPLFRRQFPFWAIALGAAVLQLAVYGLNRFVFLHRFQSTILWDILPVALGLWLFSRAADLRPVLERSGLWIAAGVTVAGLLVYEPLALHLLAFPRQSINTFAFQVGQWGYTAGMSFLALALAFALGRNFLSRILAYLGGQSLAIYVMHPLAILALDSLGFSHRFGVGAGLVIYYVACLSLPLAAAWVWQWCTKRWSWRKKTLPA